MPSGTVLATRDCNLVCLTKARNFQPKRPWIPFLVAFSHSFKSQELIDEYFVPVEEGDEGQLGRDVDAALSSLSPPPQQLLWSLLKACSKQKNLFQVKRVRAYLSIHPEACTGSLSDYLVSAFAKCGGLEEALVLFHSLRTRTVFSWTAIISGFVDRLNGREALDAYKRMEKDGVEPNEYTFVSLIKACESMADLQECRMVHRDVQRKGFESFPFVRSALINMYGKCGSVSDSENVFYAFPDYSTASWNAMLSVYVEEGQGEVALELYQKMCKEGVSTDERTFVNALQACCILAEAEVSVVLEGFIIKPKALKIGESLHIDARDRRLESNIFVGNAIVSMYRKCGSLTRAANVFSALSQHNVVSWTMIMSAHVEKGDIKGTLLLYRQMIETGICPNSWTFTIILQACCKYLCKDEVCQNKETKGVALHLSQTLHADARRYHTDLCVQVGSTLLNVYAHCGSLALAQRVFICMQEHDVVAWNAILSSYLNHNEGEMSLWLYKQMQLEGVCPNVKTFLIVLQACCLLADKEQTIFVEGRLIKPKSLAIGQALHSDACMRKLHHDVFLGSAIVNMYGKCGSIVEAESVFGGLNQHDLVSWTSLLSACIDQGLIQKALQLYLQMQEEGVRLDNTCLICILQACRESRSVHTCRAMHVEFVFAGYTLSLPLVTALINAYGSCASMMDAQAVFDQAAQHDVVSWSALISGYAQCGDCISSTETFHRMVLSGVKPNGITFLSLLSACTHAGLLKLGVEIFEAMREDFGVDPGIEHYVSIVDLIGGIGDFLKVRDILSRMPMDPDMAMWLCILGACRKNGNVELAMAVFDHAVFLHSEKGSAYSLMSNIYADAGDWARANKIDKYRQEGGAWKKPGECWIEFDHEVHSFVVGDHEGLADGYLHHAIEKINSKLKENGHIAHTEYVQKGLVSMTH